MPHKQQKQPESSISLEGEQAPDILPCYESYNKNIGQTFSLMHFHLPAAKLPQTSQQQILQSQKTLMGFLFGFLFVFFEGFGVFLPAQ